MVVVVVAVVVVHKFTCIVAAAAATHIVGNLLFIAEGSETNERKLRVDTRCLWRGLVNKR